MSEKSVIVITAGLNVPSSSRLLSDALLNSVQKELELREIPFNSRTFELREYAVDIAYNMTNGYANPALQEVISSVENADIIIVVTPIFTASMSGLFKSFFDVIDNKALIGKTVLIGATGGTTRHSMVIDYAIRPMFTYLRANVMPTSVYAAPEDWGGGESKVLEQRISQSATEAVNSISLQKVQLRKEEKLIDFEDMLASIK